MSSNRTIMQNMSDAERVAGLMGGALLAIYGLRRGDSWGAAIAMTGGAVAACGLHGHFDLYERLGIHRFAGAGSGANAVSGQAVRVERYITVNRPVHEVYEFWRDFENLPRFMSHLISVRPLAYGLYRWKAKAPLGTVEWDAQIIEEQVPWVISWKSVPGSRIDNAGSVWFSPAEYGEGTDVRVTLAYKPPAGPLGVMLARFLGEEPNTQVRDDLWRFKQIMEADESAADKASSEQPSREQASSI